MARNPVFSSQPGYPYFVEGLSSRMAIMGELIMFFWKHKWWWLMPTVLVLLLFGGLVILAQSSAISSFIYTLF